MRLVREFAFLLAILALAIVPVIGVGCTDQSSTKPTTTEVPAVDLGKKADTKPAAPKPAKKKPRASEAVSGSTTGTLGVKPPKVETDTTKK
jgi:hypothetical protein